MKHGLIFILLALTLIQLGFAQETAANNHRNFPLIITLQFNSLSMPFKNMKSNFANIGVGIGTEVSHNGNQNWVQQFNLIWYHNKNTGNGLLLNSQVVWRPTLVNHLYSEIKLGIGYMYKWRPTESFKRQGNSWVSVGKKGKGLFAIPLGVGFGYNDYKASTYLAPFAGYQFVPLLGYNPSIPVVPETFLEIGSRVHF